jgi:polyhydroxyalkanoate synthesis regulator phasin
MYRKDMDGDVEYELGLIDRMIEEGTLNREEARYLRSTLY